MSQSEQSITTQGVEILSTLFFNKEKLGVYDIPTYMLLYKQEHDDTPQVDERDCLYGKFLWQAEVDSVIFSGDFDGINPEENPSAINEFRRRVAREVADATDPGRESFIEYDAFITQEDMRDFLKIMVGNKIRADADVKKNNKVVLQYHIGTLLDIEKYREQVELQIGNNKKLPYEEMGEKELAVLEKKQLKKFIHPDYKPFVEKMNLVTLKNLLVDFAGRHFTPQGRQPEFLANMKRFNRIAASRRSGKTFMASYLATRHMYIPNQTIAVVVPTLKNHARPIRNYLRSFLGKDPDISFNKTDWEITNEALDSQIYFITGSNDDAVRGNAANLLILDEAAFLSEKLFITASALVETTKGIIYGISTVNPDTPKNRFYYELVSAEMQKYSSDAEYYGRRITLWEHPFIDEEDKKRIARKGERNMKMFQAERMAEFQEVDDFDMNNFWMIDYKPVEYMINSEWKIAIRDEALNTDYYSRFIITHDGAKVKDKPGISVIGFKKSGADIVMSGYMDGFEYYEQVKLLLGLSKLLGESKTDILIDYRNAGIAVEEIFRKVHGAYVNCIQAVGGNNATRNGRVYNVGKDLMRGKFKSAVSRGALRGFSFMEELKVELETYDENEDDRKHGHHYDILNTLFMVAWFAEKRGGLDIYEQTNEERQKERVQYAAGQKLSIEGSQQQDTGDRFTTFGY